MLKPIESTAVSESLRRYRMASFLWLGLAERFFLGEGCVQIFVRAAGFKLQRDGDLFLNFVLPPNGPGDSNHAEYYGRDDHLAVLLCDKAAPDQLGDDA